MRAQWGEGNSRPSPTPLENQKYICSLHGGLLHIFLHILAFLRKTIKKVDFYVKQLENIYF